MSLPFGDALERDAQLRDRHGARAVLLEVLGGLADADDRHEAVAVRGGDLRGDDLVGLAVVLAALGVADDHVLAVELREERARDLAGVGAGVVRREVLPAERERELVGVDQRLHGAQVGERREDRDLDARRSRACASLSVQCSFCTNAIACRWSRFIFQLPAMSGVRRRHCCHPRTSSPGSFLPSRNSRLAPPPVEMWPNWSSVKPSCAHGGGRVAAADDAEAVDLGERLGDGLRAGRERRELEHAHRAVPEHRLRVADDLGEPRRRVGADVEPEAGGAERGVLDRVGRRDDVLRVGAELRGDDDVGRQHELDARAPRPRRGSRCTVSSWSASSRLAPTLWPCAARKVNSIPPPMSSRSTSRQQVRR